MKIDTSKAVMLPMKSLNVWKSMNKQCIRSNANLEIVNRSLKGLYVAVKRSYDELSRSLDKVNQSLEDINDTLLEGFKQFSPKIVVSRDIVIEQTQQAAQSQQVAVRTLSTSPVIQIAQAEKEKEKATKVNWWKGLKPKEKKEGRGKEEKKPEVKKEDVKLPEEKPDPALPKPKINSEEGPATASGTTNTIGATRTASTEERFQNYEIS
jgi:hypothetical protein